MFLLIDTKLHQFSKFVLIVSGIILILEGVFFALSFSQDMYQVLHHQDFYI